MKSITKMLCLVDGEHYLPVTQEAIDTLNNVEHIDVQEPFLLAEQKSLEMIQKNPTLKN